MREAVAALEAAGAEVVDVSLPHTDYGLAAYYIVAPAEASANLARYDGIRYGHSVRDGDVLANYLASRGGGFGAEVKRRIMLGTYALSAGYYDAYYIKAQKVRTLIKQDFDTVFARGIDALVAPTSPFGGLAASARGWPTPSRCTSPTPARCRVNMAGLPGISVPCGLSDGLPVGLQLIGPAWSEARLLALARAYEGVTAGASWRGDRATRARGRRRSVRPDAGRASHRARGRAPTMTGTTRPPLADRALSERVRAVPPSGIRRFFDIAATMEDVISLGVGEPDFATPAQVIEVGHRQPAGPAHPLHQQLRDDRAAPGHLGPPRAPLRRALRPGHRDPGHRRRLGGSRPGTAGPRSTPATR